jgi:hypothetical protein
VYSMFLSHVKLQTSRLDPSAVIFIINPPNLHASAFANNQPRTLTEHAANSGTKS